MNIQPLASASTLISGLKLGIVGPVTENMANSSMTADGDGLEEDALTNPVNEIWPSVGDIISLATQTTNNTT